MRHKIRNAALAVLFCLTTLGLARIAPAQTLTINANTVTRTLENRMFGINAVPQSNLTNLTSYLQEAGFKMLRWGGGSEADRYHWATNFDEQWSVNLPTPIDTWLTCFTAVGAQEATCEVNYGSGTATEAANFVTHVEGLGYHFKYYEVGNECMGNWEWDTHAAQWDPVTYANQFVATYNAMKAVDPTIKIGCPAVSGEDYTYSTAVPLASVTNPRTGVNHSGFTPVALVTMKNQGVTPDFVVWHNYPQPSGSETDAGLLTTNTWASGITGFRQVLNDYLGTGPAANVEVHVTEFNDVPFSPGKQSVSLVNGLFLADALGEMMQTEIKSCDWWAFNGPTGPPDTSGNMSSSLYGWRLYGQYNSIVTDTLDRLPEFYTAKLLNKWFAGGDQLISATTTQSLLSCYAVKHAADGSLGVLVVNKDPANAYNATVSLTGFTASGNATVWSYGIPNDTVAQTGISVRDLSWSTQAVSGSSITSAFAPYSVTLIILPVSSGSNAPATPTGLSGTAGSGQVALSWTASARAANYNILRSTTSGSGYGAIANLAATSYTDTAVSNGTTYYYVVSASNPDGSSGNSNQVSGTPAGIASPPTNLAATPASAQVTLTWTASSGSTSYNVKRSTVNGSGYVTVASPATPGYTNTGLTNGTPYYFVVTAVNTYGESANSNQASATPVVAGSPVIQLNAGGPAVSPFAADADFSGGTANTNWTGAIDTTAAAFPAPQAVYQSERYGAMTYTIPGLTVGAAYTVRLHFCENFFTANGSRVFNVAINGAPALANFDIFAATGAIHKASFQQFSTSANGSGQVVIAFTNVTNNALVNGIEIWTAGETPWGGASCGGPAWAIPGQVEAENYDCGGEGVAYHDTDLGNNGGAYRTDDVDIEVAGDTGGGYDVGWIVAGEWMKYSCNVSTAGPYNISFRVAGTAAGTCHLEDTNGTNLTGTVNIPNTGGWGTWQTVTVNNISLTSGPHVLKFVADTAGYNLNWISFASGSGGPPPAPTGLTATPGNAQVALSWTASTGATSYNVLRSTVSGSGYVSVATGIAPTNYTNTGLTNGTTYYFVVTATNSGGTSANSAQASATPVAPPAAPTGLTATPGNAQVALSWTASTGATSYNVLRSTVSGSGYASVITGVTVTNYTNTGLTNGTTYYFVVTATNAGGTSANSAQASATPVAPPAAPTGLTATPGNAQVALSWTASAGATTYNVLRSTISGSGYASVATGIAPTNYTNTGLTNGTTYYFVVTATNAGGTSGNSNQASATPQIAAPPAPTGLAATPGNAQVALTWNASTGATAYDVKRSTVSGSGYATVSSPTVTNYTNTGLTNSTTYYFVVDAKNAGGTSANSSQVSATPSADPAQYNFEAGVQGWLFTGAPITGLASSTTQHFAGTHSLAITVNGAAGTPEAYINSPGVAAGKVITYHLWIPANSKIAWVQPYVDDNGGTFTGNFVSIGNLTTNAWNTITVTVPANAVMPITVLGVQFNTNATWSGTLYMDSISW